MNVEVGGDGWWGFESLPDGYRVSGEFSVEPRSSGDPLDVRAQLVDQFGASIGDEVQVPGGTFTLSGTSGGAHKIIFENTYSLFTSKNITINWCEYR